jgi:hypothetical protein
MLIDYKSLKVAYQRIKSGDLPPRIPTASVAGVREQKLSQRGMELHRRQLRFPRREDVASWSLVTRSKKRT